MKKCRIIWILIYVLVLSGCAVDATYTTKNETELPPQQDKEVSVIAFGDCIGHMPVVNSYSASGNYDNLFANVKPIIDKTDIACINQESIFVEKNFTGYPCFGSPDSIGSAEIRAGFDVICHATNHAYDKGERGIMYTGDFWESKNINMLGIHKSEEDSKHISVINRNGIKIALLNYTEMLNGFVLPHDKEYLVDVLEENKVKEDMENARNVADAILVFVHFGTEYKNRPNNIQKEWAQLFADEGATAVIGTHPHVVQPLQIIKSKNGNDVPIYYSLGNFISNQIPLQCSLCAMASFSILKTSDGTFAINSKIIPVVTHMEKGNYTAYLLEDYPEEVLKKHKLKRSHSAQFTKENLLRIFNDITTPIDDTSNLKQ